MTGPYIAVCGPQDATDEEARWAEEIGGRLAAAGAIVICGGWGGVMEAVSRGANEAGGLVIGILPGETRTGANPHLSAALPTGMGETRNALITRAADVVIAVSGEFGTLSEIALALKMGKPVIGLGTWELAKSGSPVEAILRVATPEEAVTKALGLVD